MNTICRNLARYNGIVRALMLLICLPAMLPAPAYAAELVKIGVLAFRPKPQTLAQWRPLADALKQAMPERDFVIEALTYPELDMAIATRQLDFVLTNPGHYVLLTKRSGLSAPLATLAGYEQGKVVTVFGGVVFSRAGQAQINSLADLRGKTVAAVTIDSIGGYQMQAYEMKRLGIQLPQDVKLLTTGVPQDKVVKAVLSGQADAGFVRTGTLEAMAREGKLDLAQVKVLNRQDMPDFPVQASTHLYPEWPFVALSHVDENLSRHIAAALFRLEENHAATKAIGIHGFVIPADYTPVSDMLRELRMPPFDAVPDFTLRDVWRQYRWQIISLLVSGGLIVLLGLWVLAGSRKLKAIQIQMANQLAFIGAVINAEVDALAVCHDIAEPPYVRFTVWNPSMEILTGFCMEEINRLGWYQAVHVDTEAQEKARQRMERMRSGDHLHGEEWTITRKNGEQRIVQIHTVTVAENDQGAHVLAVMHDITERKHAEKELRKKTQLLDSVVENIPNMIFLKRASDLRFELLNRAGEALLGHGRDELLGRNDYDFFPKEQADFFTGKDRATLEQDGIVDIAEEPIETPCGTRILHTKKLALRDEHGQPQHLLGISEDITERKEYEAELKRSNAELEQFSYAVSHDMRQPLRMISSYLQLIEMGLAGQLDSEKRSYFDFAIKGAKRIDQMLVDLLEYSRVGRMGKAPAWIESRTTLDEALQFLQPAIAAAQAKVNVSGEWPRIMADHDEILRLIQNLIGNAVKYRIAGRIPVITVTGEVIQNEWHLSVADNGVGIIPSQSKRLFQMFQRLQSRDAYEGTGIGLALCRKIAEHHKGRIWAESAGEGQGSRFCVVLPMPHEKAISQ